MHNDYCFVSRSFQDLVVLASVWTKLIHELANSYYGHATKEDVQ